MFSAISEDTSYFAQTKKVSEEVEKMKDNNFPGGGEYLLIGGGSAVFIDFMYFAMSMIFVIVVPCGILFVIIILQFIARLVQIGIEKKGKDIASKIFTGISIFLDIGLGYILICDIFILKKNILLAVLTIDAFCLITFVNELSKMNRLKKSNIENEKKGEIYEETK